MKIELTNLKTGSIVTFNNKAEAGEYMDTMGGSYTSRHTQDSEVKRIALAAFPNYNGQTFKVSVFSGPMRLDSNWEGGSRNYFVLLDLATMRQVSVPENGTPFSMGGQIVKCDALPLNHAIVERTVFRGKDLGITVYVNPENLNKYLSAPVDVSIDEKIVLVATRSIKSFARFEEANYYTGISQEKFDAAKEKLIEKGFLKKNGAITDNGRNAAGNASLWQLKANLTTTCA